MKNLSDFKVYGNLIFDIESEDYDAGVTIESALTNNDGTILRLNGYANGQGNTNYRPIIRNAGTPNQDYDIANKKYVDDSNYRVVTYLVYLNDDYTIDIASSSINYTTIRNDLSNGTKGYRIDCIYPDANNNNHRFHCNATQENINSDIVFYGINTYDNMLVKFILNTNNQLSIETIEIPDKPLVELKANKTQDIVTNATSTTLYPCAKAVYDQFQRKPVVIWESSTPSEYLRAIQADLSASPAWQLTNLDMTPFKRIKVYSCAGQGTGITASASTTPALILEMSLDSRAAIANYGGNYVGSVIGQKPNDNNRLATLTCAVSADKTSFVVLRQTNLYGSAATSNNDVNANVFMIEGYYD